MTRFTGNLAVDVRAELLGLDVVIPCVSSKPETPMFLFALY